MRERASVNMWESDNDSAATAGRGYDQNGLVAPERQTCVKTDGFELRGKSWFVSTEVPSDILVQVKDVTFHLHKYPLLSRSGKINRIIYDSRDPDICRISLDDLPGGAEAFGLAAKFCYGISVDLTAINISGLRCCAEYLEMTEDLEEGNLIFKTEAFLSYVVLSSWRDSTVVLKSSEQLSPWAENLQIVRRCSESIAWKACANPKGIRWAYTGKPPRVASPSAKWNEIKESSPSRSQQPVPPDWWFEDVSILRIDHFVRVVTAIKVKGMRYELIGAAIVHYATTWLPGLAGDNGSNISHGTGESSSWKGGLHIIVAATKEELPLVHAKDQRMIIESLISIIPPQRDSVSCTFLLKLLRMANMLKVAPALVTELEKRVGMQLEQATLTDLLIPSYNKCETMYDVDLVQRLLEHFLVQEQIETSSPSKQASFPEKNMGEGSQRLNAKARVARLVDSYLTEVSRDRSLSPTKFQVLAEALPESARTCDDGVYRAIDSYMKAHPTLTEHERKRLCRVMDCQKLSNDACMHAAQNERLPLRIVVQVLFSEQVKISNALANNLQKEAGDSQFQPMVTSRKTLLEGTPQSFQEGWATAKKDINTLKFDLESMKAKYLEIQSEMDNMQRQNDKVAKPKQTSSAWSSGWKKLSKMGKTSSMESQEGEPQAPNVTETARKPPRRWRNSIS